MENPLEATAHPSSGFSVTFNFHRWVPGKIYSGDRMWYIRFGFLSVLATNMDIEGPLRDWGLFWRVFRHLIRSAKDPSEPTSMDEVLRTTMEEVADISDYELVDDNLQRYQED